MHADRQYDILLAISNEITGVHGKDEMLRVIGDVLKQHIPFDDGFIMRYNKVSRTCKPYIYYAAEERRTNPAFKNLLDLEYPVLDDIVDDDNYPALYNVEELLLYGGEQISFMHKTGIKEFVVLKLIEGNALTGLFILLTERLNTFTQEERDLLHRLSYQISIATSNIIANEEIAKREKENSILLLLSNEIAAVKNKKDLADLLNKRLVEMFSISGFSITLLNEDNQTHSLFIVDADRALKQHKDYKKVVELKYSIRDGVFNKLIDADAPVTLQVDELAVLTNPPEYVVFWQKIGVKKIVGIPVKVGETKLGCFIMLQENESGNDFNIKLFLGVCAQISVAISNILAIEENARREEEKTILLSLSYEIAALRSREDLFNVVNLRLKHLFSLQEFGIAQIHKDRKTYGAFILDEYHNLKNIPGYQHVTSAGYQVHDIIFSRLISSNVPVLLRVNELLLEPGVPEYVKFWDQAGFTEVLCIALRAGGTDIGCVFLHAEAGSSISVNTSMLTGVCAQLSVAVSNILSNEEIVRREKEKSRLLLFSNSIASVRDKNVMATILKGQLRDLFDIKDYAIYVLSDDKKTKSPVIYDPEAHFVKHLDYLKLINVKSAVNEEVVNDMQVAAGPIIFTALEWFYGSDPNAQVKTLESSRDYKMTGVIIDLGNDYSAIMTFDYDEHIQSAFREPLFKSICSQIGITVSNIIANEKINSQLAEISRYKQQLEQEKIYLKEEIATAQNYTDIIGDGPEMKKAFKMVGQVASSSSTVLLLGETGTGKELIARAIHDASPRRSKLMIKVNCAALPANLIESELFGHERGSFTGATERRLGKFELANHSTLFLDEIGEMPLELQVKLLRAIQEREIERVGGSSTIKVDVRIVAATNRDLEQMMEEGKFRKDLYYRLNIFPIPLPALKNRREDIPELALHFLARYSKKAGRPILGFSNKVLQELVDYSWPGNIRELEHLIERSVLLAKGDIINEIHLQPGKSKVGITSARIPGVIKTLDENEKEYILSILNHCRGKITGAGGAAELLGVPSSTLNSKIKKLGIKKDFFS